MENWVSAKRLTKDFRLLMLLLDSGKEHGMNLVAVQVNRLGAEDGKSILGGRVPLIGNVCLLLSRDLVSF